MLPDVEANVLPERVKLPTLREVGESVDVLDPSVTSRLPVTSRLYSVAANATLPVCWLMYSASPTLKSPS